MNAEPETDPFARLPAVRHTLACAMLNSTRVDWLAKDLYRYFPSSGRRDFREHCRAIAVSKDMNWMQFVGGDEGYRSSSCKILLVIFSNYADRRFNCEEFLSSPDMEVQGPSGEEIAGIYRNGGMVMGRNVNLTLDVVRGHGAAGIRPIGGSAGFMNRGAPQ